MRFPYFVTDVVLLSLSAASVLAAFIYPGPVSFGLAMIAAAITAVLIKKSHDAMADFGMSVGKISGLSWKPVFLSMGTLELEYLGTRMRYSSALLPQKDEAIPVDYRMSTLSGTKSFLEITGSEKPGEPEVRGERKLYERISGPVAAFDRKYGLGFIRNRDGLLEFSVTLGFSKEQIPKDAKLEDMSAFFSEYVSLVHEVGKALS